MSNNNVRYNDGFKEEIAKMIIDKKHNISTLAKLFGISRSTIYQWISSYKEKEIASSQRNLRIEGNEKQPDSALQEENIILQEALDYMTKSQEERCQFIYSRRFKYSLETLCKILKVKPKYYLTWSFNSNFHHWKTERDVKGESQMRYRSSNRLRIYGGSLG